MKKLRITFFCCCIIVCAGLFLGCNLPKNEYLRIHIRANSNDIIDQNIKYQIRDIVVEKLTPMVKNCNSKSEAISVLNQNKSAVKALIDGFLNKNGFNYGCKISIREENFPTRVYEDITLEAGYYDALIIELGDGVGDNWWCVVYPPLCFIGSEDIEYRSKIIDFINSLGNNVNEG
ncbi:MAG: stage II sporulation protein R [Clostridia bacterium]|nr:stage II sporulation protein R [Clostridia bacterium]